MTSLNRFDTHTVENQPSILNSYNLWRDDKLLKTYVTQQLPEKQHWNAELLGCFGALAGNELMEHGELANKNNPSFVPLIATAGVLITLTFIQAITR